MTKNYYNFYQLLRVSRIYYINNSKNYKMIFTPLCLDLIKQIDITKKEKYIFKIVITLINNKQFRFIAYKDNVNLDINKYVKNAEFLIWSDLILNNELWPK